MSAIAPGMILIAYLCGSISSAILVCRIAGLPDPRQSGSGNPGATNVLRIGGKGAAVAVLIFDVLKGMLPVWGAYALGVTPFWLGLIAIAACLGHIWPVFFGFKGGKGVATAFGAIAPIGWDLTGVMAGTWLLTVLLSGYSSLGAIVSALIAPFYVWWFKPQFTFPVSMLSCLILLRHHDNIQRLWRRQETKIWTKLKKIRSSFLHHAVGRIRRSRHQAHTHRRMATQSVLSGLQIGSPRHLISFVWLAESLLAPCRQKLHTYP